MAVRIEDARHAVVAVVQPEEVPADRCIPHAVFDTIATVDSNASSDTQFGRPFYVRRVHTRDCRVNSDGDTAYELIRK